MKTTLLDERIMNAAAVATSRAESTGAYAQLTAAEAAQVIAIGREGAGRNQQETHARLQANRAALGSLRDDAEAAATVREAGEHEVLKVLAREHREREAVRNRARDGVWYATFGPPDENHPSHVEAVVVVNALATAFGIAPPPIRWCRELDAREAERELLARADNLVHSPEVLWGQTDGHSIVLNEELAQAGESRISTCAHELFHAWDMARPESDAVSFGMRFADAFRREGFPTGADLAGLCAVFAESERRAS